MQAVRSPDFLLEEVKAYNRLERIHGAFEVAARGLEQSRAATLCVEDCGACCELNTPHIREIEGRYIRSVIFGNGSLSRLMSICEGWLLDRPPQLVSYDLPSGGMSQDNWRKLRPEVIWLLRSPCPLLDDTKRCILYSARPLSCRAYGVTRLAGPECRRPQGANESGKVRAYYGGPGAERIQRYFTSFLSMLPPEWRRSWFLPTFLYALIMPGKFDTYSKDGKIASAKLIVGKNSPSLLWYEEQQLA